MAKDTVRIGTPTKQQELDILDRTVYLLGPQSYLGPWLQQVKGEVERDIRSDFFPSVNLAETRQQAERLLAEAKAEAERIVATAQAARERAERAVDEHKAEAARAIAVASEQLRTLATRLSPR